uniref:Uncharacterized protein n=1 Tax=Oryza nivara TaxID=4536 RepID=A0A0E0HYT7_ORYNI
MPRHSRALPTPGATTLLAAAERCHPTCRRAAHHPSAIVHLIFQLMVNTLNSRVDSTRSLFVSLRLSFYMK